MSDMPIGARAPTQAGPAAEVESVDATQSAGQAAAAAAAAPSAAQTTQRALSGGFAAIALQSQLMTKVDGHGTGLEIDDKHATGLDIAPQGYDTLASARTGDYVQKGSTGEPVKALQRALKQAGLDVGETGAFDEATLAAVRKFQADNGCKVDGIVGPETLGAMDKALGLPAYTPPPLVGPAGEVGKTGNAFIDSIGAGAVQSMRDTGVPASVTIAQAILESGWGKSGLSKDHFNFFGIKGKGTAGSANLTTDEFMNGKWIKVKADFRKYNSAAESLTDHANLLAKGKPYTKAMSHKDDPNQFAHDLTGVYATAPNYGDKLVEIMKQFDLYRFDAAAKGPGPAAS